jgi:hypothetical protein
VPSFVLARAEARRLLARSRARDAAIYGELAGLIAGLGRVLPYVECRGLDWETPDRHRRAVRRIGVASWRRRWDTPAEWQRRRAMASEFSRGFVRVLRRHPVRSLRLLRIAI